MDVRQPIHSDHARTLDTEGLRRQFLVERIFDAGKLALTYSQIDRIIVGGAMPLEDAVAFTPELARAFAVGAFLERRELGVVNIGGPGSVVVDGTAHALAHREALYVGMGARDVRFASADAASPAKFYLNSVAAHQTYPTKKIGLKDAEVMPMGDPLTSNERVINKLFLALEVFVIVAARGRRHGYASRIQQGLGFRHAGPQRALDRVPGTRAPHEAHQDPGSQRGFPCRRQPPSTRFRSSSR